MKKTMISVTTKTGDGGVSGLANGERLSKADLHFEVVGTLDELNSWLGLVVVKLQQLGDVVTWQLHSDYLQEVQDMLFYIGAEVALSPKAKLQHTALEKLEHATEELQGLLADDWHTRFVLPGGTEIGAWLDIARTVCRRAERGMVQLQLSHPEMTRNPLLIKYINRLSDYLYVLRVFMNDQLQYEEREFVAK